MRDGERFFYGWVVVATSALGLLFGTFPIVVSSFTIFFKSYLDEFHAGRGAISLALTVHNLFAALLAAYIGRQADRFGARKVILPGLGMLALVLLSAQAIGSKVWQLYMFYSALGIVSSTTTSVPYGLVVSRWFSRQQGLALGLTMTGLGLGAMIAPPLAQSLIARYGWRSAFAIAGGAILLVPVPIVGLFLKEAPKRVALLSSGLPTAATHLEGLGWREIRKSPTFWVMIAAFVLAGASVTACVAHMSALFLDRGAALSSAALAPTVVGFALLAGRAGTGFFLDRYFGPRVAVFVFGTAAVGIALLWTGVAGVPALVGAFLVGLAFGAEGDIVAYLTGRYFGLRALGVAFGFTFGAFILASGLGPLIMGFAFDRTGSYRAPLAGFFIASLVSAALMGSLGPYRIPLTTDTDASGAVRVAEV
jgi:MFS family permease